MHSQLSHQIWNCHQKSKYNPVTNTRRSGPLGLTSYHIQGTSHSSRLELCLNVQIPQKRWSPQDYPAPLGMCPVSQLTWSPLLWKHLKNFQPCCLVSWVAGVVKAAGSHKQENTVLVFFTSLHCPWQNAARSGERNKAPAILSCLQEARGDPPQRDM